MRSFTSKLQYAVDYFTSVNAGPCHFRINFTGGSPATHYLYYWDGSKASKGKQN